MTARPGRLRAALLTVFVAAALAATPGVGLAAGDLTATDPPDGAALDAPPSAVTLTFSRRPDVDESHVSVRNDAGQDRTAGALAGDDGNSLRMPVALKPGGDYTIAFHVVFADGSDLTGIKRFSVGTGAPPAPLSAEVAQRTRESVQQRHSGHGPDWIRSSMLMLNGLVLVGVVVLLVVRRPRKTTTGARWVLREPEDESDTRG
ncbi:MULTISPECIES: copper resistance protein CopC [Micromonospora]|uniref:CopC domain-containing protein n=1 Tax=Micromonospora maris TaxID=1003110 RepID=A0A9X0I1Z6_9ACTN|nr:MULTISPECIES: copper resistance CopC family protein [Micromonospora]AEB46038.1 hypothetical protein VAB18032_24700 [Micromonospora maris AB-18-032]KUJ45330.1 hypothetical protein ADL17_19825 [Micromonospora maris]